MKPTTNKTETPKPVRSGEWLGRSVDLPNFLPSTLPVAFTVCVARWTECDPAIAWWSIGMLVLHAVVGVCDIMANHYRKKLMTDVAIIPPKTSATVREVNALSELASAGLLADEYTVKTISKTPRCDMLEEISEPVSVAGHDAMNLARSLEEEIHELRQQYKRLHSQVSGYLYGEEWEHWKKYNEPKYAPAESANAPDERRPEQP